MTKTSSRNPATQKQAKTWLTPEQIERIRDACLSDSFATYLQDRNETLIVLLADTGLRVSELVALDWETPASRRRERRGRRRGRDGRPGGAEHSAPPLDEATLRLGVGLKFKSGAAVVGITEPQGGGNGSASDPEPKDEPDDEHEPEPDEASDEQGESGGRVGLLVSADCEHLIQELLSYKEEQVGTAQAVDHAADALRYACMGVAGGNSGGGQTRIYYDIGF